MVETWLIWTILIALIVAICIGLWVWRGVWLVQHKGQKFARTRWHLYVRSERKARTVRSAVMRSTSVTLEVQPVTLEMAMHAYNRQRKNKHRKVEEEQRQVVEALPVVLDVQDVVIVPRLPNLQPAFIEVKNG